MTPFVTADDILTFIWILIGVMLVVVLYHLLFIVVDLRKILRRFDDLTAQVEAVILKPISMADQLLTWLIEQVENRRKKGHVHGHHHKE